MELKDLIEKIENEGTNLDVRDLAKAIKFAKENNSAELAYLIADIEETQRSEMEKIVLKAKNPLVCAKFATDIPGANVDAHKKIIFASKNIEAITYLLCRVKASKQDIKTAQQIIVDKKDAKGAADFYASVDGSSFKILSQVAIKEKDIEAMKVFKVSDEKDIEKSDKSKVSMALGKQEKRALRKEEKDEMVK